MYSARAAAGRAATCLQCLEFPLGVERFVVVLPLLAREEGDQLPDQLLGLGVLPLAAQLQRLRVQLPGAVGIDHGEGDGLHRLPFRAVREEVAQLPKRLRLRLPFLPKPPFDGQRGERASVELPGPLAAVPDRPPGDRTGRGPPLRVRRQRLPQGDEHEHLQPGGVEAEIRASGQNLVGRISNPSYISTCGHRPEFCPLALIRLLREEADLGHLLGPHRPRRGRVILLPGGVAELLGVVRVEGDQVAVRRLAEPGVDAHGIPHADLLGAGPEVAHELLRPAAEVVDAELLDRQRPGGPV